MSFNSIVDLRGKPMYTRQLLNIIFQFYSRSSEGNGGSWCYESESLFQFYSRSSCVKELL